MRQLAKACPLRRERRLNSTKHAQAACRAPQRKSVTFFLSKKRRRDSSSATPLGRIFLRKKCVSGRLRRFRNETRTPSSGELGEMLANLAGTWFTFHQVAANLAKSRPDCLNLAASPACQVAGCPRAERMAMAHSLYLASSKTGVSLSVLKSCSRSTHVRQPAKCGDSGSVIGSARR